ncbi:hypothetical protein [Sanyastnella coralliicola]|uniref:hypothetical protein n=1 Tax=Sanyastnella coralliicola TaxID=3069118 RepID=UPI0027B8B1B4|nr:hypothetical protein [Longitalea sp. SCSIO 12813]
MQTRILHFLGLILACTLSAISIQAQDGCTDPLACNYDLNAVNDDGSCEYNIFIPFNPGDGPAILSCANPQPGVYHIGNQDCLETLIALDPYCVNTNWDAICQNDYEACLGCDELVWMVPYDSASAPAIQGCADNVPEGYYIPADQTCLITVLQSDTYCTQNAWDVLCQNSYDLCALGCLGNWHIPIFPGANPPVYACQTPAGYMSFPQYQECIEQTIAANPECLVSGWNETCDEAFDWCAFGCTDAQWLLPYDATLLDAEYGCPPAGDYYVPDQDCLESILDSDLFSICLTSDFTVICEEAYNFCQYGCSSPDYWLPYETDILPAVISCDDPGNDYYLADAACLEPIIVDNPDFFDNNWSLALNNVYEQCLLNCNFGAEWYIPLIPGIGVNPAVYACSRPLGYWEADQDCVLEVILSNNDFANIDWTNEAQEMYNLCALGCPDATWYIPDGNNIGPAILACEAPEFYSAPIDYYCMLEILVSDGYCTTGVWDDLCNNAYLICASVGCTYEWACNYSPLAVEDDGTCGLPGCMDPTATNYDPQATCDDSSCIYVSDCQADFDGNGQVDAGDLLTFLASFGLVCD